MPTVTIFVDDAQDKWSVAKDGSLCVQTEHGCTIVADAREFADFLQSELAKAEPDKPDDDDWIEWNGGECPVDPDDLVDLVVRRGWKYTAMKAGRWGWRHDGESFDIVRYRLSKGGKE